MADQNKMHNLTTLIKRLEAATSRLEDIAGSVDGAAPNALQAANSRGTETSSVAAQSQTTITPIPEEKPAEPLPRQIEEFDGLIEGDVAAFVQAAAQIGGLPEQQARAVQSAFQAERNFLLMTTKAKKPDPMKPEIIAEIHKYISEVDELKETNRASPFFTHLSMVSEGIVGLGWIMETRPADYVVSALGGAQYNGNKVLKEYKEKDPNHVKYVRAYEKVFKSLATYCKEHFKTGLTWNNKDGIDAMEALNQIQSGAQTPKASQQTSAGGPPPPPPPPLPVFDDNGIPGPPPLPAAATAAKGGDMTAVFDQLNQGDGVTKGLRKVDRSEMTHKNPSLRAGSAVPQRSASQTSLGSGRSKSPMPARKPESLKGKKPGKKELDGQKWIVENFDNTGNEIIEIPAELNHSILITKCTKCIIKVNGKANAISIDNCSGLSILVESLVSSIDVIKSPKFAIQVDGVLPTIMLDQVDGGQIYLQEASMRAPPEIFTSKCSSINIVTPPTNDQDDSKESPLPEQLRSYFRNGRLHTEIVEHAG
ncbi:suppressor of rasval19 [Lithohypha guttulata]|uniref:suppressor of rasval19 n=1 Tax=Lithohypha guttulata TaxID=1690604 RepID=UPI002DE14711|nr:suppressor of rasval19 [Lithohypha guttulata]KAK5099957.1 suppressor of rasval19 [Lithohypha guttulata]